MNNAKITFTTDLEPVECEGVYTPRADGFILDFCIGENRYTVEHGAAVTRFSAYGLLSYIIELKDERTSTRISSPYGEAEFDVQTQRRELRDTECGSTLECGYSLIDRAGGITQRTIRIEVRL